MLGIYEYIVLAEAAQKRADEATDPGAREAYKALATDWRWLADFTEQSEGRRPAD